MENPENACFHCGEAIPEGVDLSLTIADQERFVCCAGCQAVAQLIHGAGLGRYYQFRQELARKAGDDVEGEIAAWEGCDSRESTDWPSCGCRR